MKSHEENKELFLRGLPFFKKLGEDEIQLFLQAIELREYTKGHNLFLLGDTPSRFFIIMDGWIKLFRTTLEGEEVVLSVYTRGDTLGETSILEDTAYSFSTQIVENAKILEIPASFLRERAHKNPDVMRFLMAAMAREMNKLQLENEHLSVMSAPQKVGCLLLQISSGMNGKGGVFTFPYEKSLAAARLGMKAETFSRALSQLKPYGVNVRHSEIEIANFHSLIRYVCGHCSSQDGECHGSRCVSRCNL